MNTLPSALEKTRILFDLKPALDGYAGIPQETRLLFRGLRSMASCEVEGLIQHGGRRLRAGVAADADITLAKRVNRFSRVAVSLREIPRAGQGGLDAGISAPPSGGGQPVTPASILAGAMDWFTTPLIQTGCMLGLRVTPSVFEGELFHDFLWRTFFSKTLQPGDKGLVTAARYSILRQSRKRLHQVGLSGRRFSSTPRYLGVKTQGYDVMLAQTPFPGRVSRGTRLVVRYHDAVPLFMPHTIADSVFHQASHFHALQENVRAGAWFSCVSEATRADLLKVFPEVEPRSTVIHNIVSDDYFEEPSAPEVVRQIIRNRVIKHGVIKTATSSLARVLRDPSGGIEYLLMVSTIEPRKNHLMLMAAWERLKYGRMPDLKLVVVGNPGWAFQPVLETFRPWAERGDLFHLVNVPAAELRVLYRHAAATLCPSLAEGFDYSGIEAMRCGGIVISSDIPVHREVFGEGSVYFDPYSAEDAAAVIERVLAEDGQAVRNRLRSEGLRVAGRYTPDQILPRWESFFAQLRQT